MKITAVSGATSTMISAAVSTVLVKKVPVAFIQSEKHLVAHVSMFVAKHLSFGQSVKIL